MGTIHENGDPGGGGGAEEGQIGLSVCKNVAGPGRGELNPGRGLDAVLEN